ncbi:MAG: 2-oxoacid:acceptor oxidoreductase family protein [Nanoarchaeota archaeon]|nr:2-oxoacid:acceptor oxidoreductase family protein [Nanoarchaeota archaeon]
MKRYIFIGRGGQGAKSGASILARAAAKQGLMIQAFPEYGPERMGAPVKSYVKISKKPIRSFSQFSNPDFILLIDKTLVKTALEVLSSNTILIINDVCEPGKYNNKFKIKNKVVTINASSISMKTLGMDKPNVPILGALIKIDKTIDLKNMEETVKEFFSSKGKKEAGELNVKAVRTAYEEVKL